MHRIIRTVAAAGALLAVGAAPALAAETTVVVDEQSGDGIELGGDAPYTTPWTLTTDQASIGNGSLHVEPITNSTGDEAKFIGYVVDAVAGQQANQLSASVDYLIDDVDGDARIDSDQVYINVYVAPTETTDRWYGCRYDYVAAPGTGVDSFATLTATGPATNVVDGDPADDLVCPADLASLDDDASVSFVALNVGDTSGNDQGVGAYLDAVTVTVGTDTIVYDLEKPLAKADCKDGGHVALGYRNQGACVSAAQANANAGK